MSDTKNCSGCKGVIVDERYLQCSICMEYYDLICANVPEVRFYKIMTKELKNTWQCVVCKSKQPKIDNTNTPVRASFDGVTVQRGADKSSPVYLDLSIFENSNLMQPSTSTACNAALSVTTSSIPQLSDSEEDDQITSLKHKISQLTNELDRASNKIIELTAENEVLKKTISELKPHKDNKKSKTKKSAPKTKKVSSPQINDIKKAGKVTMKPQNIVQNISIQSESEKKMKLCMISSNNDIKMLEIAKNSFSNSEICHYLYPKCGIGQLIKNIDVKLKDFTKDDCCIIFIGQEDFKKTNNYFDLVLMLRETLSAITHTNIILCLPIFKCADNTDIFNWRLECFNNLLYLDNHTHNYVYLLDTNLNLSFEYDMFSRQYGTINYYGMKRIFKDLENLIQDIEYNNRECDKFLSINNLNTNDQFFL